MMLSQREAATQWHLSRVTIQRAIKTGKLTLTPNKKIDVAEMVRAFGEPKPAQSGTAGPLVASQETAAMAEELARLRTENAGLRATVEGNRETIDVLKQAMARLGVDRPKRRWWQGG